MAQRLGMFYIAVLAGSVALTTVQARKDVALRNRIAEQVMVETICFTKHAGTVEERGGTIRNFVINVHTSNQVLKEFRPRHVAKGSMVVTLEGQNTDGTINVGYSAQTESQVWGYGDMQGNPNGIKTIRPCKQ